MRKRRNRHHQTDRRNGSDKRQTPQSVLKREDAKARTNRKKNIAIFHELCGSE
jgi:hypothetical protein